MERQLSLLTTPYSLPSTRYPLLLSCSLLTLLDPAVQTCFAISICRPTWPMTNPPSSDDAK